MTKQEIKTNILNMMNKKPGYVPTYKKAGTNYKDGSKIFAELREDGFLVHGYKLSPTGRRMNTLFTKENAHLSA